MNRILYIDYTLIISNLREYFVTLQIINTPRGKIQHLHVIFPALIIKYIPTFSTPQMTKNGKYNKIKYLFLNKRRFNGQV